MKNINSKTVLECVFDMESLHSNRAVWIYWGIFLKIHHLPVNSAAMVGSITDKCLLMWLYQCRESCWCCKCVENSNLDVTVILDLYRPSTMLSTNVETMPEHCLNVGPQCWALTITQHSCNVAWMLSQHRAPTLRATLPQSSQTLPECCLNVIPQHCAWM